MSWRKRAGGGKRDSIEGPIREALEACGRRYWPIGGTGNPDGLIWSPTPFVWQGEGFWLPAELKTGKGPMTANQQDIIWPVWRSVDEALQAIGVKA